ncbi:hypothetical protein VKT23_020047, partial [Stygiomarasmius scandens]
MSVSSPPPPPITNSDSDSGPGTVPASSPTSNNDHDLSLRTSTSANSFQQRISRRTHGSATPRSPSTSSYTSTTSTGTTKSRKTRSLRPPTWRAGSVRVKDASASVTTSFETSSKAKGGVVTSASEPSVSLINAESSPSFEDLVEDDDMSSSTLTARPGLRERRGRMDSSASVASLSMYINNSPNRTGTGNVEARGRVTYGQGAGKRIFEHEGAGTITREGEGRRRLMGLFNDLEERYTEPPEPMASANSSDSSNSNDSAISDTPTVTLASVGDARVNTTQDNGFGTVPDNDSQNASSSNVPHDHDSTATTMTTTADATPTITTTTTINTTNTVPEPKSYVPNFPINQPNTDTDTSALPNPMTDSPINNDDTQGDNSNANIALNPSEISISDSVGMVDASKETQDVTRTRVDSCSPTSASTSVPGSASASASWFGSLGKMMGRRVVDVQPPPVPSMVNTSEAGREEGKEDGETATDDLDRTPKLGSGVTSTGAAADSSTSAHEEATITVKPVENESLNLEASISDQTIREKTPSRDSKTAPTAASSKKSWFFTSTTTSPTPPETVTEAATVTATASASATDALVASTSGARPSSRHSRTSSRDSPPHSASTAASSFPSSPLTSSSFPSSIDDVPRLVLNETGTSQEGEGTIRPRHGPGQGPVVQRLRVVSMHKQMGLEEQARVGTLGLGLVPVVSSIGGEAGSSGEGEALNDTDTTNEDAASLKSKNTVTSGTTAGTSPRQPRKRIDSLNSLNPSTSRFSIVGVPLPFWSAPSPGPGPVKNGGMDKSKSHADSNATTSNASSSATPSVSQSTAAGADGSSASAPATASNANTSTNMTGSGSINATTTSAASNISFNTGPNTTSNSTSNSNSKSVTPVPNSVSTLSSKSGPVTALSTDVVNADVDVSADALDARGELVRVGSVTEATEGSGPREGESSDGEVKVVTNSEGATQDPASVVASTSQATTTMEPTSAATYTGSWWDYVGWGSSTATAATATGASSSSAGAAEGAKEPSSSDQAEAQAPSSSTESSVETNTSTAASESTMALAQAVPPQTAPPPSQLVQPDHGFSPLPSATEPEIEIKSAPPTVPDTKPPRAASVFSGETVRSGAASWLAPWTWYSGSTPVSGSAGPSSVVAASSSATSVDRGSRLKRQMTESEKVKEEALARDREREQESKAESEAEAGAEKGAHQSQSTGATETKAGSSEQGQQQRVEQPLPSDSQSGNNAGSAPGESGVEALAGSGSGSSVPAATTVDEPATANAVTTLATTSPSRNDAGSGSGSGWTSFFSLTGKGKSPADRHADDGKGANVNGNENEGVDDEVRRDENGMEVMDLDSDEEGFGGQTQTPAGTGTGTDAQPGVGVNEASKDVATIDAARGKELVKKEKETMREILKAGATSPERKVSLVKALLLQPSSPKPASILSSSSPVKAISPPPESPTKAASTRSAGPSTNGKDQTEFKARGRTDSILTTATTTSNASEMAKRAPLLVVSDDIKAKAAAKAAKSAAKEKEKEREKEKVMAATAGPEVLDGKKAVEKKSSKDPVKEKEKKKEKEEKRSKSKSGSGSSTPAPPSAPPNLVLPTWSDTFYTAPRSHLPSGVLPTNPLPGTEAYEAMVQMQGKNIEHKGLGTFGKTMKYVSGVLFSGDRGSGGSSTSGNGERKRSSLFGGSTAPGSSAGARFSDALAGRRGSSGSTSSIPVNTEGKSGPISPRIAALRAGSSSGRGKGGSVKMGSTELEKLKEKEAEIEAERRREKEKLYWDWGRGLPRAWEVVEYGQPVGLMESEMKDEEDAKEKLEKEQDKSPPPQNAKEALSSQTAMPGMGLEPATTLSLPADMLTAYKGKGKYKANTEVSEAVQDVLKGCKKVVVIGIHGWFPG